MQRLKQHNLGTNLRLNESDLLLAVRRPQTHRGTLRIIRLHVELGGYAERSHHEVAPSFSHYCHRWVQLDEAGLDAILAALRVAFSEQAGAEPEPDPNGDYRKVEFRDGGGVYRLCTEYVEGLACPESPAAEAAWALLEQLFTADTAT